MNFCQKCSAMLPKLGHVPPADEPVVQTVTERYLQLKAAGAKVVSGAWSADEYAAFLDSIGHIVTRREREIRDINLPAETLEDFRPELEAGLGGIDLYGRGLAMMKQYLQEADPTCIEEGLELIRQGNDLINDAMRINRENRRKLEETCADSSTMI